MISHTIICSFLIPDFKIKLLKEQNPTDESWLGIFIGKQVLKCSMIHVYYRFITNQVRSKLVHGKDHGQKFLLCCGIVELGPVSVLLA